MGDLHRIPLEVRQMIYTECLVVGKVFPYAFGKNYDEYDGDYGDEPTICESFSYNAPEVALLRACKAIHQEAEPLLYQRNTFRLPVFDLTARFFKRSLHNEARRAMVKCVNVSFKATDLTRDEREQVLDVQLEGARYNMLFPEQLRSWPNDFKQELHEAYKKRLQTVVWPRKASFIFDHLSLEYLMVDFTYSKCNEGCCNMRPEAAMALRAGFARSMPKSLKLRGLPVGTEALLEALETWTARRMKGEATYKDSGEIQRLQKLLGMWKIPESVGRTNSFRFTSHMNHYQN